MLKWLIALGLLGAYFLTDDYSVPPDGGPIDEEVRSTRESGGDGWIYDWKGETLADPGELVIVDYQAAREDE